MLFNSIAFAFFLPIVFILYWHLFHKNLKVQNFFLIVASYLFYGWWDWRFLALIFISSMVDYLVGVQLHSAVSKRKLLLFISIFVNLGLLGFFKYYNFFVDSLVDAFAGAGIALQARSLNIILPVGISFYTFQTLSYTIDIYFKKIKPTHDILAFFAFVSFFPQLVAGPIERAKNLLPQFQLARKFDLARAKDGMRQILWGLFKKIVIADQCGSVVDSIFASQGSADGSLLLIGGVLFAFQIYCDFSGYSDIAIGVARIFGFDLMRNFAFPYFSRDIAEFWRRWHISLSTWFRDYVYIPLGGSRGGRFERIRNIIITFTVSGFWHGANWTFVGWGFLNGLYYIPLMLAGKQRSNKGQVAEGKLLPTLFELGQIILTFFLTVNAWIIFRSPSIESAFSYLGNMYSKTLFYIPDIPSELGLVGLLVLIEWFNRDKQHPLQIEGLRQWQRWLIYYIISGVILYSFKAERTFIYFQF